MIKINNFISFKMILSITVGAVLFGCANTPSPHLGGDSSSLLQTRIAILPSCPVSKAEAKTESVAASVASVLIPPLIDAGYATLSGAVTKAGEANEVIFSGNTISRFYSSSPVVISGKTLEPYELLANNKNGCIVIVHGYFSNSIPDSNRIPDIPPAARKILEDIFGVATTPQLYYEGSFVFSSDRAGFRIRTETILYPERMQDHKNGLRDLNLTLTFSKPSATQGGTAFAVGGVDLGLVNEGFNINESPIIGYSKVDELVQTTLGTAYLPLPALDSSLSALLTSAKSRVVTQRANIASRVLKLKELKVPGFAESPPEYEGANAYKQDPILAFADELGKGDVQTFLNNILQEDKATINELKKEISELKSVSNSELLAATYARDDLESPPENDLVVAQRNLNRVSFLVDVTSEISEKEAELLKVITRKGEVVSLLSAEQGIRDSLKLINVDRDRLTNVQPYMLLATLTEKKPANPVLGFFASVLSGGKEGVTTALKEGFDPATIKELEEQEEEKAEQLVADQDTAKKEALSAILNYRGIEIEIELLKPDVSAIDRHNVEQRFAIQKLDTEIACRKAKGLDVEPDECSSFL